MLHWGTLVGFFCFCFYLIVQTILLSHIISSSGWPLLIHMFLSKACPVTWPHLLPRLISTEVIGAETIWMCALDFGTISFLSGWNWEHVNTASLGLKKKNLSYKQRRASLVAQMVKNLPAVWETWIWSLGWEDPLEKEMATHSNIFAWRIPWTEEPGRL